MVSSNGVLLFFATGMFLQRGSRFMTNPTSWHKVGLFPKEFKMLGHRPEDRPQPVAGLHQCSCSGVLNVYASAAAGLVEFCGLARQPPVGSDNDLVDLLLGLTQLLLAMPLEGGAAFIGLDRLLELGIALFQGLDQGLQLGESFLEAHLLDCQWFFGLGHDSVLAGRLPRQCHKIRRPSAAGYGRRRWPPTPP